MHISTKKLSITILLILVAFAISTSFYTYVAYFMSHGIEQYIAPYGEDFSVSDKKALSNFTNTLYPLYKSLDEIMNNVINNKSNSELFNISSSLVNQAKEIDSGNKGINDPYGLPSDIEGTKRLILDQIMTQFKLKNPGRELVYTFIATDDCNMYLMESYASQKQLLYGAYPDHPWCVKFYDKQDRAAEYVTEFYYSKSQFTKVSTIIFPLHSNIENISFYLGGTLDLLKLTNEFFKQHDLGEWPNTQLLLLVNYQKDGSKALFDPQSTGFLGHVYINNLTIAKYQNTSFTEGDERRLINHIESFDKDNNVGKTVETNNGTYMITATSRDFPNAHDVANPIQNHAHLVEWEWVLIRHIPDTQATVKELMSIFENYKFLNLLISSLLIVAIVGIVVSIILYKKLNKIKRGW